MPTQPLASPMDARRYHHGDLRQALIIAAELVLERDGAQALSLRAVAREAGVSPAAPYHHFKDKSDLLVAVAGSGFEALSDDLGVALAAKPNDMAAMGVAYVKFARANPALYRVMYDSARNGEGMPARGDGDKKQGLDLLEAAMARAGAYSADPVKIKLACIAAWCAAHGVAEMVGFNQFEPMIEAMGSEEGFVGGLFQTMYCFQRAADSPTPTGS